MKLALRRMMTAMLALLTVTVLTVAILPLSVSAAKSTVHTTRETALELTADPVTEVMKKNTDERWYKITLSGAGDAVIVVRSGEEGSEYDKNWDARLYAADGETEIGAFGIKGELTIRSYALHATAAETYYLRIRGLEKESRYYAGEYTISVVTALAGTEPDYGAGGILTVDKAGEVFLRLGDTYFIKLYDGEAKVALYQTAVGEVLPILFGGTEEAAAFVVSSSGTVAVPHSNCQAGDFKNKHYYYSYSDSAKGYVPKNPSLDGVTVYMSDEGKYGMNDKLEKDVVKQIEIAEYGAVPRFFAYNWGWFVLGGALIVVVGVCFFLKGEGREEGLIEGMIGTEYK